jgi:hypothetical protein
MNDKLNRPKNFIDIVILTESAYQFVEQSMCVAVRLSKMQHNTKAIYRQRPRPVSSHPKDHKGQLLVYICATIATISTMRDHMKD